MEIVVLASGHRHGVEDEDIRHAIRHALALHDTDDGLVMAIGPDRTGALLEVGVVESSGVLVVVHAMIARPKYLR